MAINSMVSKKNFLQSRFLKKNLEFAAKNGALYSAGVSFVLSAIVRPIAIFSTPSAKKEDKQYASTKSIASALIGLGTMALVSTPIVKAVETIKKLPENFLSKSSVNFFKSNPKYFSFAQQLTKISSTFLYAHPKSFFTAALIPPLMAHIFNKKTENSTNSVIRFCGTSKTPFLAKNIARVFDSKIFQKIAEKYADTNIAQHLFCANDILLTQLFIHQTMKNKNIERKSKKTLCANAAWMTGITIVGSYLLEKITKKPTQKMIEKFKELNKNDILLDTYLEGFKVVKPVLILGGLYYIVAPMLATYLADKFTRGSHEK